MSDLVAAANRLRELHVPFGPLLLANIWDAASAQLAERAGFPVIATSSGAVAESLGFRDGQRAPADEMFAAAARIARAVEVPVTVDAEGGYGLSPDELVGRLIDAGAAGCNLEDTAHPTRDVLPAGQQADWLRSVREAADKAGVPLVLNARVDVFVRAPQPVAEVALVEDAVTRAKAYLAAGADCVYPIGMRDPEAVRQLVAELAPAPVNVNPLPDRPIADLGAFGAARVSLGVRLWRQTQSVLADRLAELAAN